MQKEVTIYDIAEKLGISPTTVSRGLNNNPRISQKTTAKILKAAESMGYRQNTIASNLRKQESRTIGVLLHEINSYFMTSVLAGIEKVTNIKGYNIIIVHSAELGDREIVNAKNLFTKRVDGVVASLALDTQNLDHFNPFLEREIPVIFFDRVPKKSPFTTVVIDNFNAGYDATTHLLQQGCKRIGHITANLSRNVYQERYMGYKKAITDKGLKVDDKLLRVCGLNKEETVQAVEDLLRYKPDGFFITNDFAAAVCIETLHEHGFQVPQDIAVVGFNNDVLGDLISPKLTTVDYPGILMGETAAEELFKKILQRKTSIKTKNKQIIIPSKLVIRDSSKKRKKLN